MSCGFQSTIGSTRWRLGALVATGQVSAGELLEAALERADARNPALNAIVHRADDVARGRAAGPLPAGPLAGVPFLIKDLLTAWRGQPMTFSSRLGAGFRPSADSEVVRRLEAAGLILFGTTNAPEFGILAHTEPAAPWPVPEPVEHATTRRAAPPAGRPPRWLRASCRPPTATTAGAPSASRPPTVRSSA